MIINTESKFDKDEWWNQSTQTYVDINHEIKNDWKIYKINSAAVVSFDEFENKQLKILKESNPELFDEYCKGLIKTADRKTLTLNTIKNIVVAGIGITYLAGVFTGLVTPSLVLGGMALCTMCAANFAIKATGYRFQARHILSKFWTSPTFKIRKVIFNLHKKDNEHKRIYIKDYPREAFLKEVVHAKLVKRAALPQVVEEYIKSNKIEKKPVEQCRPLSRLARLRRWWWKGAPSEQIGIGGTGLVSSISPSEYAEKTVVESQPIKKAKVPLAYTATIEKSPDPMIELAKA